jgi:hypothetical protein
MDEAKTEDIFRMSSIATGKQYFFLYKISKDQFKENRIK